MSKIDQVFNSFIIVYVLENYVLENYKVRGSLTTSAIIWYNLLYCFSAMTSKL